MILTRLALFIAISTCFFAFSTFELLAQTTEFNTSFINTNNISDKTNIDLSTFSRDGYIAPGDYLLDLYLNDRLLKSQYLIKAVSVIDDGTVFCITPDMVDMFALKDEIVRQFAAVPTADGAQCADLSSADSHVTYHPDSQSLMLTLPQAWLQYQDPDWVPPARWSPGVNGVILDYNLLANRNMPQAGPHASNYTLYGTLGLNLGAWRLRSDYQYNRSDYGGLSQSNFEWPQTYLFRPLPQWQAKLTLGQTYLASSLFDSFRFAGMTLASDERMLPPSLQGYAPQVSGIANSNAQVSVSQNGRLLYQTRVSPGPFVLPALNRSISGTLDISLQESNGDIRTWQVNTASVPFMTRKNNIRYQVSAGRPLFGSGGQTSAPNFVLGEATWGAFNNTSLYGGLIATSGGYQALTLGAGQNLGRLGALSLDVTRSDARLPGSAVPHRTGYSYRINYAKTFDKLGSTVAFMGYRFSGRHFMSLQQYIARLALPSEYFRDDKQSYTVSYSQYVRPLSLSVSLSLSRQNYWNDGASNYYMLSLNKTASIGRLRNINLSLSLARSQSQRQQTENQIYATLGIPLGENRQLSYGYQQSGNRGMHQTLGYTDYSSQRTSWNLNVSDEPGQDRRRQSLNGNIQSRTPYGRIGADFTMQPGQYRNLGLNWYGSITATAAGVAFSQPAAGNEPRIMIDTDGIGGVSINSGAGMTNRFGLAVVNNVSSYSESNVSVDVNALPQDVDVSDSVINQVLTEGAIGYAQVRASHGQQFLGYVQLDNDQHPPLGASVQSARTGKIAGMVGDGGLVYLSGVEPDDRNALTVTWGNANACRLTLPENPTMAQEPQQLPCR